MPRIMSVQAGGEQIVESPTDPRQRAHVPVAIQVVENEENELAGELVEPHGRWRSVLLALLGNHEGQKSSSHSRVH